MNDQSAIIKKRDTMIDQMGQKLDKENEDIFETLHAVIREHPEVAPLLSKMHKMTIAAAQELMDLDPEISIKIIEARLNGDLKTWQSLRKQFLTTCQETDRATREMLSFIQKINPALAYKLDDGNFLNHTGIN